MDACVEICLRVCMLALLCSLYICNCVNFDISMSEFMFENQHECVPSLFARSLFPIPLHLSH